MCRDDILKLASDDPSEHWQASMDLKSVGLEDGVRVLEGLTDLLRHPVADVRLRATEVIATVVLGWSERRKRKLRRHILDNQTVDLLIPMLRDEDSQVRMKAATALAGDGGFRAVEPLIDALEETESLVQTDAIRSLGRIGDERAVEPLIALLEDERESTQTQAARALGEIGDDRAVKPLLRALRDKRLKGTVLGCQVLTTLGEIGVASVVLHKYLAHKAINAYIGVHGYNDQEVATATG